MNPTAKVTYISLSADDPALDAAFEKAIAEVRGALGRSYPLHIAGRTRDGEHLQVLQRGPAGPGDLAGQRGRPGDGERAGDGHRRGALRRGRDERSVIARLACWSTLGSTGRDPCSR